MHALVLTILFAALALPALAQSGGGAVAVTGVVSGVVRDESGGVLPGVNVQLRQQSGASSEASTDARGAYAFDRVPSGHYLLTFTRINFGGTRREIDVTAAPLRADAVLHLAMNADVMVSGRRTFANLADVAYPAGESRRHRAVSEPGRYHLEATRRQADHACG